MKESKITLISRILLGLILFVFGLNKFLQFIPAPPLEGPAADYMGGLAKSVYFFPLLALTEMALGLAFLTGRWVALALVILAPVALNMVLFHLFLAPSGIGPAAFVFVLGLVITKEHFAKYKPILQAK